MRVLGAIRQSKTKDRAVSPAAQRRKITEWTEQHDHQGPTFTEDLSKAGKLDPFKRPGLGPYLTNPALIGTWDILVTTRIDRANRHTRDFLKLMDWCDKNGKLYVSLSENIDMTTPGGRRAAWDAASSAEWESDMARIRRAETVAELEEQGRWIGGPTPYGMKAEQREEGYYLVPDVGGTADIANAMADLAISGQSNVKIRDWLNEQGHLNSAGLPWSTERARLVLHSSVMEDVLGHEKNAQMKLALLSRAPANRGTWESGKNLLLGVGFCKTCGRQLYPHIRHDRPSKGHFRCLDCKTYIPIAKLEQQTVDSFLFLCGDEMRYTKVVRLGDQHAAERFELTKQIEVLKAITDADVSGPITELQRKLDELHASIEPHAEEWVPSGQTVAEYWDTLETVKEQNEFLRLAKVRVEADKRFTTFKITDAGVIQATHVLDVA